MDFITSKEKIPITDYTENQRKKKKFKRFVVELGLTENQKGTTVNHLREGEST